MSKLKTLTKKSFKDAIIQCLNMDMTTVAPLGASSDEIILNGFDGIIHEDIGWQRISLIQIRNYCGDPELLITDRVGNFLFYGRIGKNLGVDLIVNYFYLIFMAVKPYIAKDVGSSEFKISENANSTAGFKILNDAIKNESEDK